MDADPLDPFAAYNPGDEFAPDLPDPSEVTESQCECCPHAETMYTSCLSVLYALGRQTEVLAEARKMLEGYRRRLQQDAQLLEDVVLEKYDLQRELNWLHQEHAKLQSRHQDQSQFLAVIGYKLKFPTAERPASE